MNLEAVDQHQGSTMLKPRTLVSEGLQEPALYLRNKAMPWWQMAFDATLLCWQDRSVAVAPPEENISVKWKSLCNGISYRLLCALRQDIS